MDNVLSFLLKLKKVVTKVIYHCLFTILKLYLCNLNNKWKDNEENKRKQ